MTDENTDVEVQFMDGERRTYPKVIPRREEGVLVLRTSKYYGQSPIVKYVLPLCNIREVEYK
jgi:hypothetical protein